MSRLSVAFGVAVAVLVGTVWWAHANTESVSEAQAERDRSRITLVTLRTFLGDCVDTETGARGFALTGDERFLEPLEAAAASIPARLEELAGLTADAPPLARLLEEIRLLAPARLAALDTVVEARRERGLEAAIAEVATLRGKGVMDELRRLVGRMEAEETRTLDARIATIHAASRRADHLVNGTRLLAFGVLVAVFLGLRREIRRRRAAEDALRAAEGRLRLAIEGADLATLHWDLRDGAITWSERGLRFFGLEGSGPLPRERFLPSIHPDDLPRLEEARRRMLDGGTRYDVEFRVRRPDGGARWIAVTGRGIPDGAGAPGVVQGVGRDITARRQAEEEARELTARLASSNGQLEAANRELEAFAYSVSHDLRAPLRSIDGFGLALAEDAGSKLSDDERGHLGRIRAAAARMSRLIDDLLELSRVGRSEIRREDVDLSATARAIVAELRASEPERDVTVEIADGVVARGDAHLLRIVLTNLLSNAWKYTGRRAAARIRFDVEGPTTDPSYLVRDDGVGFDMAYAQKLFGVFQRLHSAAEFPGTGVGLAIVQRIVRRHGGEVTGVGTSGEGAEFRFTLGPASTSSGRGA